MRPFILSASLPIRSIAVWGSVIGLTLLTVDHCVSAPRRSVFTSSAIKPAVHQESSSAGLAAPGPTTPPFAPTPLQPSIVDATTGLPVSTKMQEWWLPKLMRRGFAGQPINSPKGLASKIKALEVDVPKRKAAAKYLGSVDCQEFPESQEQLVTLSQDPFEPVRYEAACAFVTQFSRGHDATPSRKQQRRKDTCRGCCDNTKVLNALTRLAFQCDAQGCWVEPSARVRDKLREALNFCSTCDTTSDVAEPMSLTPIQETQEAIPEVKPSEKNGPVVEEPVPVPTATPPEPFLPTPAPPAKQPRPTPPPEKPSESLNNNPSATLPPDWHRPATAKSYQRFPLTPGYSQSEAASRPSAQDVTAWPHRAPATHQTVGHTQPTPASFAPSSQPQGRWREMPGVYAPQQPAQSAPFQLPGGLPQ